MKRLFKSLLSLFFVILFCAADWLMFHGADGMNRSPDTGLLTSWPESGPRMLWKIDTLGEGTSGYSSMTFVGDRMFTSGTREGKCVVYCLDENGKILWERENGPAWTKNYPGTRSTPTIDGELMYDFSPHGRLLCMKTADGEEVWSRNILEEFEAENIIWALAESVAIDGERLICSPGGKKWAVIALDKRTGETIWATPSTGAKTSYSCATFFKHEGRRILGMMYEKGLMCINPETGELLCTFEHLHRYGINCVRPIYHEGNLLLVNPATPPVSTGSVMLKLNLEGDELSLEEVWRNRNFDNLYDSVMLIDGRFYGTSHEYRGGMFMCVEPETGKTAYENRETGRGSFTFAEGLIYFMSENRDVFLIRPNPEKFDPVSRFKLPEGGEGPSWSHPVVHEKKLYLRHGKHLYCYDIAK